MEGDSGDPHSAQGTQVKLPQGGFIGFRAY